MIERTRALQLAADTGLNNGIREDEQCKSAHLETAAWKRRLSGLAALRTCRTDSDENLARSISGLRAPQRARNSHSEAMRKSGTTNTYILNTSRIASFGKPNHLIP